MTIRAEGSDLSVAATEFRATLGVLGLTQRRVAEIFNVAPRSIRRWQSGDRRVPHGIALVMRLLAAEVITITQAELAAAPVPTRANGGAEPAPPEPTPTPTPAPTTTAEKVFALAPNACCWPYGDPRGPDFHFCGNPVTTRPYCEHHRTMAYVAPSTRRLTKSPGEKQHPSGKPTHLIAFYEEGPLSLFNPAAAECSLNLPCSAWLGRRPRAQGRGLSRG
jgi:hypothetical protein